ncbi:putative pfam:Pyridox_oxidase [Lyophyllum shimeji]|uniref:Pfam:Pyridox_oxidase n=1 Tax=Lyophyllum shimeji TaxID=47721 RepID=A0A9P3PSJ9_LYOSH|nr:putative pfam:Pyridox_oxidase [Lyophyllum shimeji]
MVQYFDKIPDFLISWIDKQKIFWVATAPLTGDGLVNISPKGRAGSFRVVNPNQVWYEDLTGSGIETVAHVRENGRITVLFNAFEGPPRILRLYGKGRVYEFGTPEYEALLPPEKRQPGSRSIIMIDVFKVGTSCGYAVPFYEYKAERNRLHAFSHARELVDIDAEKARDMSSCSVPPRPEKGLKQYWFARNATSLDGLPGILTGHDSLKTFRAMTESVQKDDEREGVVFGAEEFKMVAAFLTGVVLTASYMKFIRSAS